MQRVPAPSLNHASLDPFSDVAYPNQYRRLPNPMANCDTRIAPKHGRGDSFFQVVDFKGGDTINRETTGFRNWPPIFEAEHAGRAHVHETQTRHAFRRDRSASNLQ